MKPTAPLLALPCSRMKPSSPLRAMKGHYWAISTLQRCCRFQGGAQRGLQRCCWFQGGAQCVVQRCWWFQSCPVIACYARKSSPCATRNGCEREKVRPAAQNGRKMLFQACWASFFAGEPLEALCWASFFADEPLKAPCWASFFAEQPLKSLMGNVSMCVRSPCGHLSSAGEKFACNSPQGISSDELGSLKFSVLPRSGRRLVGNCMRL